MGRERENERKCRRGEEGKSNSQSPAYNHANAYSPWPERETMKNNFNLAKQKVSVERSPRHFHLPITGLFFSRFPRLRHRYTLPSSSSRSFIRTSPLRPIQFDLVRKQFKRRNYRDIRATSGGGGKRVGGPGIGKRKEQLVEGEPVGTGDMAEN